MPLGLLSLLARVGIALQSILEDADATVWMDSSELVNMATVWIALSL